MVRRLLTGLFWLQTLRAEVVLNEVMTDPLGPESSDEFVELLNTGPDSVDLAGWMLAEGSSQDGLVFPGGSLLAPRARLLILDPAYAGGFDSLIATDALVALLDNAAFGNGGLANGGGERLEVLDPSGQPRDALLTPASVEAGRSWERVEDGAFCAACFVPSRRIGGSPGARNPGQPGRSTLCLEEITAERVGLTACGSEGFRDSLRVYLNRQLIRADSLRWPPDHGEVWPLPALDWGQNALRLETGPARSPEILLDSLLWNPASPVGQGLWLNELQPAGPEGWDWIELAADRSVILDGLALDWGRDPLPLTGELDRGRFLLVGRPPADRASGSRVIETALSITSTEGHLALRRPDGQVLEGCAWTSSMLEPGRSLERGQPGHPAERARSWGPCVTHAGHSAGLPNSRSPLERGGAAGVQLSTRVIRRAGGELLGVELVHPGGPHRAMIDCYDLEGRRRAVIQPWAELPALSRHLWDGRGEDGRALPAGLYLVRVTGEALEALEPVAIQP